MAIVKGYTEFSQEEIAKADEMAKTADDEKARGKALRFKAEMAAYNMRSLRGDFDSY